MILALLLASCFSWTPAERADLRAREICRQRCAVQDAEPFAWAPKCACARRWP